jgi:hypothetical protein
LTHRVDIKPQNVLVPLPYAPAKAMELKRRKTWTRTKTMKNVLIAATFAVCATAASAQTLTVEGETGVTYTVVSQSAASNGNKTITTRRDEAGASIYSEHEVSCDPYRAGLAGTAPSLEALQENATSNPTMEEIIRFSAEDQIAGYACAN